MISKAHVSEDPILKGLWPKETELRNYFW